MTVKRFRKIKSNIKAKYRASYESLQSSEKFENILNQTLDCIYIFTSDTLLFVYANRGAQKLVGYNEDEVLRITLLDIMTEFDKANFRQMLNLLMDGTQSSHSFEAMLNHKDGRAVLVEIHLKWVKLTLNESRFVAIVRDITERNAAEKSIGYLSRIYSALAQSNQAIVRCEDEVTLFNEVCQIAVEFGGMKMSWIGRPEEKSGLIQPIAAFGGGTDYLDEISISARVEVPEGQGATGTAFRENHPVIIQNFGTDERTSPWHEHALFYGWGASAAFPLLRGGMSYAVLTVYHEDSGIFDQRMVDLLKEVATDISYALDKFDLATERQQAKDAKNAAEVANKLKSSFLANMSHEIRTPLNSMLGFASILFEEENDLEKLEKLEIIINSGDHLLSLINNILDFSKIEAGKMEIERGSFSIHKLLNNIYNMFILKSQERHLSWAVHIDPSVPEIIVGDEHRIMQVLINLTGNAFKFTELGEVSVQTSYQDGQLEIRVKDSGIGIPKEKMKTIFSAFEQMDSSHTRKYGGTGLGLSITQSLLNLMGGSIRIESTLKGSEFIASLPTEIVAMTIQDDVEVTELEASVLGHSEQIIFLVADENEQADRDVVQNIVKDSFREGYSVQVVPYNSKTKDRILVAAADLILLFENIGNCKMDILARDLKRDFRTSFLPIILLKKCSGDRISFIADSNALKYGKVSEDDGFFEFIRQMIQGRETFGAAMIKSWLQKVETEIGTDQILLNCLNDIAIKVNTLENALVDQAMDDVRYLTHSLKGGTGNLRMSEVYLKISSIETELLKEPSDLDKVREDFSLVKEMMRLIPKKYFDIKQLQPEKQQHEVGKMQFLVVDDNRENRKLIGHVLDRMNLRHKDAETGEEALKMLQTETFDMVLLDSQMPVMDGMTTLKRIREDLVLKDLHVIIQTANTLKEDIREFFRAGCNDYISKPVDLGILKRKLEEFIAKQSSLK